MKKKDNFPDFTIIFKSAFLVTSGVLCLYICFKFFPDFQPFINQLARYLFILMTIGSLILLSLYSMYGMLKRRETENLIRSFFGFASAVVISLIVGDTVNQPVLDFMFIWPKEYVYLTFTISGLITSKMGTELVKNSGPLLVFACFSIALLIMQVLTVPGLQIDIKWLLFYLLGVVFYPLVFYKSSRRKDSIQVSDEKKSTRKVKNKPPTEENTLQNQNTHSKDEESMLNELLTE
ncbi:membrane protein [Candidatus Magnetomorum sp. HK-1]|nr:membrane protein [Candidatus Magnetomorum sp. HK-1]